MPINPSSEGVEPDKLDLNPFDSLVRFSVYREYKPEADVYYSDLYTCDRPPGADDVVFVLPHLLSGSDYSGGSVTVDCSRKSR